jgi:hypothetical protein
MLPGDSSSSVKKVKLTLFNMLYKLDQYEIIDGVTGRLRLKTKFNKELDDAILIAFCINNMRSTKILNKAKNDLR